jgi:hypothetical protein
VTHHADITLLRLAFRRERVAPVDRVDAGPGKEAAMPRSPLWRLLFSLAAMVVLTTASAQVRLEPTVAAFPANDDEFTDEPTKVGIDIRTDDSGIVIVLTEAGAGALPDIVTGFAGEMPTTTLGGVDVHAAMNLCQSIVRRPGGFVLTHEEVGLTRLAAAYRTALEDAGLTFENQHLSGSSRTLVFTTATGQPIRLSFTPRAADVEVYVGR